MPHLPQNRELLRRFREGESAALAEVYRHYAPGLGRFLRNGFPFEFQGRPGSFCGFRLPMELLECVQEVFTRGFGPDARLAYDGIGPFAAYLAGIARNYVLNEFRRRQTAAQALSCAAPIDVAPEILAMPDLDAEEAEAARLVAAFVERLPDTDRRVYEARFLEDRTQSDAAARLCLTRIQVRRVEARIRRGLLKHLKTSGYLEDRSFRGWSLVALSTDAPTGRREP